MKIIFKNLKKIFKKNLKSIKKMFLIKIIKTQILSRNIKNSSQKAKKKKIYRIILKYLKEQTKNIITKIIF